LALQLKKLYRDISTLETKVLDEGVDRWGYRQDAEVEEADR
jgi:hypothetical protein